MKRGDNIGPEATPARSWKPPTLDVWSRALLGLIAAITAFAAVSSASSVFAPVACALFIIALVWPMQRCLQAYVPKLLALAIVMIVTAVVFVIFASLIAWSFGRVGRWLVTDAAQLQALYGQATSWLEERGIAVATVWSEHFNVSWLVRMAQEVSGHLHATIGFWLVVVVYVILGLLEVDDVERKLRRMGNSEAARILLDGSIASAAKFRRYMLIRTATSAATGALVWLFAAWAGLQFAAEWGVIAFSLNYIPFIGPFIATMFPTFFALVQFASWQTALAVFACLNVIQFVIGSYIEPRLSGIALAISPFVVLLAVFFWTYLWGVFGAFIGVPITIAMLTFCAQHPSSRWVSDLLGAPGQRQELSRSR
ncbi:MAG TPA: AI-2E family transporter [Hyphomicrobiaceae bacterium]|nr:AI-2E family transporter [Hyphomicrobiaceae bacterium]